jgi:esterase/lipase superfamily enzyme
MSRVFILLCFLLTLVACSPRGLITMISDDVPEPPGATLQTVFIASNRQVGTDGTYQLFDQRFGEVRAPVMRYGRIDISIPPIHNEGQIEWPADQSPDPAKHFVARSGERYTDRRAFLRALPNPGGREDVVLFVHGFNVNNAEAIYRLAQIAHDFESESPVISFSWPSAGDARGYVYDRDSVIFARDDLETLLTDLSADGRRVLIVAHSMGGQLVMETLRQISISGNGSLLSTLEGVALISPDIDEDVFVRQAQRIHPFPQPFMVMVSRNDRALGLSALMTGTPSRVGSLDDPKRLAELPVEIIDLSDIEGGDRSGHSTAFTAPAAIRLLRSLAPDL